MPQELAYLKESASQTAGPYVHIGLAPGAAGFDIYRQELGHDITGPNAKGERIRVEGRVVDTGEWSFETVKPGMTKGRNVGTQAPHLNFWIVARGINIGLNTRMYFGDEAQANAGDPVLNLIEWKHRRATLIAERSETDGLPVYRFDIQLQGENETVFFDV